jgi:oligopeptide transport system ATP-binding protein
VSEAGRPLVEVQGLTKVYRLRRGFRHPAEVRAVDDVSLQIIEGETLGIVGESGCGKSTLARCVVRLAEPDGGALTYAGQDITHLDMRALRPLRREIQMIFQDPMGSLNPLKRVGTIVEDALVVHKRGTLEERRRIVRDLFRTVGLGADQYERYPAELSGGQRQRVGIARALVLSPRLVVADEPVSALDVSVRAEILNLMQDLQDERRITYLFISHDLGVVRQISDRVGVMYLGKLVEIAPAEAFFTQPVHRYSEALLASIPAPASGETARRKRVVLQGEVASPIDPPSGCRFHPRCPHASEVCRREEPLMRRFGPGHHSACHHPARPPQTLEKKFPPGSWRG